MIPSRLPRRLLTTLFVRSQNNDYIDLLVLSERAGASPYAVLRALAALEDAGLVDARRLRLSWSGLALASALVGPRAEAFDDAVSSEAVSSNAVSSNAVSSNAVSSNAVSRESASGEPTSSEAVSDGPLSIGPLSDERAASARHAA